jgi:MoaA/NifB/PqqE/SkfB family radical SAM enzyme
MPILAHLSIPSDRAIASLFLLPECDMACRFCGSESGFETMGQQEAEDLLETLEAQGVLNVVLGGGEPLLWPHQMDALIQKGRDLGLLMQLCTTGLHLSKEEKQWPQVDRLILPLESLEEGVHDWLRRYPGGHHRVVMQHLEQAVGTERRITVSTVVTRENIAELPRLGDHLAQLVGRGLKLHAWHLYRFIPTGRAGTKHRDALDLSAEDYLGAVQREKGKGRPFPIFRRSDLRHPSSVIYIWRERGGWKTAI